MTTQKQQISGKHIAGRQKRKEAHISIVCRIWRSTAATASASPAQVLTFSALRTCMTMRPESISGIIHTLTCMTLSSRRPRNSWKRQRSKYRSPRRTETAPDTRRGIIPEKGRTENNQKRRTKAMKKISRTYEKKEGRKYIETYRTEDENQVYKDFANEIMYKLVFKSPVYKSMKQYSNYDGTRTVIFYQDNGRSIYIIKA